MKPLELKYLKSLSKQYPNIAQASTEIINLSSILNLPKGTEHFLSDIHGNDQQFNHIIRNGSGSIRAKIDEVYGKTLTLKDKKRLSTLIYYPEQKLEQIIQEEEYLDDWYRVTLNRLIRVCSATSSKYTRSKVRKALPKDFAYIIEELIYEKGDILNKEGYYSEIIDTMIRIDRAKQFIIAICNLIQHLSTDHLHIIGDIYDRGAGSHLIMEQLMHYHSVDIQWGNHDILWMGAASGHLACIANVIRVSARYGNLNTLEEGYGINLIPLATFALKYYKDDDCDIFNIQSDDDSYIDRDAGLDRKMHKAITMIQFKLEAQLMLRRPGFEMQDRILLDKIDYSKGTITMNGKTYPLKDLNFPTIDPNHPLELTADEQNVMERLKQAFLTCDKLQRHIKFLFDYGSLYLVYNSNLLYHGCVPLDQDGSLKEVNINGKWLKGRALYDELEKYIRNGYYHRKNIEEKLYGQDMMWYIWSNENSPVYGKEKMATFERYFVADKKIQEERKGYYYQLIDDDQAIDGIFRDFGLDPARSHIINGHMPVELLKGDTPIKCNGKLLIIDGGFSKAYHKKTGIAGYTLVYNSYGLRLVSHEPFTSTSEAIINETDIHSDTFVIERAKKRTIVADTDVGTHIKEQIEDLEKLLRAYREGLIREKV